MIEWWMVYTSGGIGLLMFISTMFSISVDDIGTHLLSMGLITMAIILAIIKVFN